MSPNHPVFKFTLIALIGLLGQISFAQKKSINLEAQSFNYTTLAPSLQVNSSLDSHPEGGILPFNAPCENCYEVLEERKSDYRLFKGLGEDASLVYSQSSLGDLHYLKNGVWRTIDTRLRLGAPNFYEAPHQKTPISIDFNLNHTSIKNPNGDFSFNKNLVLLLENQGTIQVLAHANYSNYTVGADGAYVTNVFPDIDLEINVSNGSVKTNFIINSKPTFTEGRLVIRDNTNFPNGWYFQQEERKLMLLNASGDIEFNISKPIGFSKNARENGVHDFAYRVNNNQVDILLPLDVLTAVNVQYPYIVDPLINSPASLAQASIAGPGYGAICFSNYCSYNLNAIKPANSILVDAMWSFNYKTNLPLCYMEDAATTFHVNGCSSPTAGYVYNCNNPTTGTCNGVNVPMWSDISSCMPAASCAQQSIPFTMRFYQCYMNTIVCSDICVGPASAFTITLVGRTVEVTNLSANGNSTITVCAGTPVNLSSTAQYGIGPYTYTWNPGNLSGSSVTVTPTSTTTYTSKVTTACGDSAISTILVSVVQPPATPVISSNGPICEGQTLNLSSNMITNAVWSGPNGFTSNIQNPTIPNASVAASGTYTAYSVAGTCSSAVATLNVVVNSIPAAPTLNSNSPLCTGNNLNLTSSTLNTIWSGPNNYSSSLQNPTINSVNTTHSGNYTAYTVVSGCTSLTSTISVSVSNTPATPTVSSNSPVCSGQSLNLTSNATTGAYWTGPNNFTSNVQNPNITNAATTHAGTYSLVVIAGTCTSGTATAQVVVNQSPVTPTLTTNSPICTGNTLNLSATGTGLVWSGPNNFTSNVSNPSLTNSTVNMAGQYSVYSVANGCTSATASANVVINVTPPAPTVNVNAPLCEGQTISLSSSAATGNVWTGPLNFSSSVANPTIPNATPNHSGNYILYVVQNSCTSAVTNTQVNVNPNPAAPSINANAQICSGSQYQLNVNGAGNQVYWTGPNNFTSTNLNPVIPAITMNGAGDYFVYSIANGCSTISQPFNLVVIQSPPAPVISSNSPLCVGDDLQLNSNIPLGIYWLGPNSWVSAAQNPTITNVQTNHSGTYSAIVFDGTCTSSVATQIVQVNPIPPTPSFTTNSPVCEGGTLQLGAPVGNNYQYIWTGPAGFTNTNQNPQVPNFANANTGSYSLMVVASGCSSDVATQDVDIIHKMFTQVSGTKCAKDFFEYNGQIFPLPGNYELTYNAISGCDSIVQISVTNLPSPIPGFLIPSSISILNPNVQIEDISVNAAQVEYHWSGGVLSGSNPIITFSEPGFYEIWQYVQNGNCKDSVERKIQVQVDINAYIPNAFTPNIDDINQEFKVFIPLLKQFEMTIYNRWGEKVFETNDIYEGWNGGLFNDLSKPLESATYVYRLVYKHLNGEFVDRIGHVTLIR